MTAIMRPAGAPGGLRLDAMTPAAAPAVGRRGLPHGVQIAGKENGTGFRP
jgi:hypothetical protein